MRNGRDDTPSVIREVGFSTPPDEPLGRESLPPVLAVKRSYILWRRARIALIAAAIVATVSIAALLAHGHFVRKEVAAVIARALAQESVGGAAEIRGAGEALRELAAKRGDRPEVVEAAAWLAVLDALVLGGNGSPERGGAKGLGEVGEMGAIGAAAAAGRALLHGEVAEALELAEAGLIRYPGEPRLALVRATALDARGDRAGASRAFAEGLGASPLYFPLAAAGVEAAIRADDPASGAPLARALARSGTSDRLLVPLAEAAFSLGAWGDGGPGAPEAARVAAALEAIAGDLEKAPPKLRALGDYVRGRALLAAGDPAKGAASLKESLAVDPSPRAVAWCGLAILESGAPDEALALLDAHPGAKDPAIFDLRARAQLASDRVDRAAKALAVLEETGALPGRAAELAFELAVKRGDAATALGLLPERLDEGRAGAALELFLALEAAGDKKGVVRLSKAFGPGLEACGKVMRTWHTQDPPPALKKMGAAEPAPCVGALAGMLLPGRAAPDKVRAAFERASPEMRSRLVLRVVGAMVAWRAEGRDAAVAILDGVAAAKPEGAPAKIALAEAYLELHLPDRAVDASQGLDTPDALAVRYRALRAQKSGDAAAVAEEARRRLGEAPNPALSFVVASAQLAAGAHRDAAKTAEAALPNAGRYTAEIAEVGAKAVNLFGDRADADRLLLGTANRVGASLGLAELWELELAYVRLNLVRGGGKFLKRAEGMLDEMRRDHAVDARIPFAEGMIALRKGRRDDAVSAFQGALALDPTISAAYAQLEKLDALDAQTRARMEKILPGFAP